MPSAKILERKQQIVKELADQLKSAESIVLTDYQGLNVAQDTEMREALREAGVSYKVVKNEVARRALETIGVELEPETLVGPVALSFSSQDVVLAPRLSKKFVDKFKKTKIKGGVMDGKAVGLDTVMQLANIPETEVLYGQLVSGMIFPIRLLAMTLGSLQAKMEEAGKENVADMVVEKTEAAQEDQPEE